MDLSYTPEQEAVRVAVRAWLAEHIPSPPFAPAGTLEGFTAHRA